MKTINIDIPEGYAIDVEASDFTKGKIVFKPVQKKWEDFGRCDCWRLEVENGTPVTKCEEAYVGGSYEWDYPTEELLLAAEAQRQLLFFRNKVWKEDGDWNPNWEDVTSDKSFKKAVIVSSDNIDIVWEECHSRQLAFRTYQIAKKFLHDHRYLIEQAKPLL